VSCTNTSGTLLAASSATGFILIQNPATASNPVWVNPSGGTASQGAGSIELVVGASLLWSTQTGFLPTSALNCYAASSTSVTISYK
jgi:hypothetical protein